MADIKNFSNQSFRQNDNKNIQEEYLRKTTISPSSPNHINDIKKEDGRFGTGYYLYMKAEDAISKSRDLSEQNSNAYITPITLTYDGFESYTPFLDITKDFDDFSRATTRNRILFNDNLQSILDINVSSLLRRLINLNNIKTYTDEEITPAEDYLSDLQQLFKLPIENEKNVLKKYWLKANIKVLSSMKQKMDKKFKKSFSLKNQNF